VAPGFVNVMKGINPAEGCSAVNKGKNARTGESFFSRSHFLRTQGIKMSKKGGELFEFTWKGGGIPYR